MYLEAHSAPRHSLFQPLVMLCYVLVCKGLKGVLVWYRLLQDGSACLCTAWSVRLLGVGVSGGGGSSSLTAGCSVHEVLRKSSEIATGRVANPEVYALPWDLEA